MSKILGIDLGTTNSAMAYMTGGKPTIIANSQGGRLTPSVVAVDEKGDVLVGTPAKNQAVTNPEGTKAENAVPTVSSILNTPLPKSVTLNCPLANAISMSNC